MHYKAYQKFKKSSLRFTLPIIIISTVTGTANFAQETFPESWKHYVPVCIGAFNLVAAIMTTILQFLKINELMESHRVSSIHYGKLSRSIRLQLTLPPNQRGHHGLEFVESCNVEYDRLIEQSPPIPGGIIKQFEKEFPLVADGEPGIAPGMCTRFMNFLACKDAINERDENLRIERPEIIKLTPIKPFGFHDGTTTSSAAQTSTIPPVLTTVKNRHRPSMIHTPSITPPPPPHISELKKLFVTAATQSEASEDEFLDTNEIDVIVHDTPTVTVDVDVTELKKQFEN